MMKAVAVILLACLAVSHGATLANTMVNASATLGNTTTFTCQVDGAQGLGEKLSFFKIYGNSQSLLISEDSTAANATKHAISGTYVLTIKDVTFSDEGEYTCQLGSTATSTAYLAVGVAPTSASLAWAGNVTTVTEGVKINMTCSASTSYPPATMRWFRGTTDVTTTAKVPTITVDSNGYGSGMSHLELTPTAADEGVEYTCHVDVPGAASVFQKTLKVALSGSATIVASVGLLVAALFVSKF